MDQLLQTSHFSLRTSFLGIIRLVLNPHLYPQLMDVPYLVVLQPGLVWFFSGPSNWTRDLTSGSTKLMSPGPNPGLAERITEQRRGVS